VVSRLAVGGLDWMTSGGPFRPQTFYDFYDFYSPNRNKSTGNSSTVLTHSTTPPHAPSALAYTSEEQPCETCRVPLRASDLSTQYLSCSSPRAHHN